MTTINRHKTPTFIMEDNEKKVEDETIDEEQEEVQEVEEIEEDESQDTSDEPDSDDDSLEPSLEDHKELEKKLKTIEAQKEHWRKKVEKLNSTTKKTNTEQASELDVIEISRLANQYTDEDLSLLQDLKAVKGYKNLTEATQSPIFKESIKLREAKDKKLKAQLPASRGGGRFVKGDETHDDLKKKWINK